MHAYHQGLDKSDNIEGDASNRRLTAVFVVIDLNVFGLGVMVIRQDYCCLLIRASITRPYNSAFLLRAGP